MISIINVPNIQPAEFSTPTDELLLSTSSCAGHALPSNCISIHQNFIIFNVVAFSLSSASRIFLMMVFSEFHIIFAIVHPAPFMSSGVQDTVAVAHDTFPLDTAFIMMSPNERVSHTIAGTNASPMNSLILKLSSSHPNKLDPATNRNVNNGAKMAYIQSLMALTRSIDTRAIVSNQKTMNIIAAMIP